MRLVQLTSLALLSLSAVASPACGGGELASSSGASPGAGGGSGGGGAAGAAGAVFATNVDDLLSPPKSCAYACPSSGSCKEQAAPYQCPALAPWAEVPHLAACGAWDGQPPSVVAGQCQATLPTADAAKRPGLDPDDPSTRILPDGHRVRAAGAVWEMQDSLKGGMTAAMIPLFARGPGAERFGGLQPNWRIGQLLLDQVRR